MTERISNIEQGITNDEGRFRIKCGMTEVKIDGLEEFG